MYENVRQRIASKHSAFFKLMENLFSYETYERKLFG